MDTTAIPKILTNKSKKLPKQITYVIAYSCAVGESNIREAMEVLDGYGTVEIIDVAFQYDDNPADVTGLVSVGS